MFLPPLESQQPIVTPDGKPSAYFLRYLKDRGGALTDVEALILGKQIIAGLGLSGGGVISDGDVTIDLENTAVTPGSYTNVSLTVDAQGRITAASNGSGASIAVDENGTEVLSSVSRLNFTGSGVTVTDLGGGEAEINISGSGGGVPTTVQFKSIARANLNGGITLDVAPTNGSILVAIVLNATATAVPAAGAGWTVIESDTNLPDHATFYRFAGAGESATQNPTSSTDGGSIIMYEISGALGAIAPAPTTATGTVVSQSIAASAWTLLAAVSGLMIGWSGRRTEENGTLSGSFTNEATINGAAATTGGTGVSIVADSATKSPGASLPSATGTWPTSVATKTGIIIVY